MAAGIFEKLTEALRGEVLAGEPLSRHTTWRTGGPADLFITPADRSDLLSALRILKKFEIPWQVVGFGSNLLVRDGGVRGAAIHLRHLRRMVFDPGGTVRVEGGLPMMSLVGEAARRGFAGVESLAGIPGSVGGAIAMNAGAGGREIGQLVESVVLAGPEGEQEWPAERLAFGYRSSALPPDQVVAEAKIRLRPEDPEELAREVRRRLEHRRRGQNVGFPNAGSVFKNPPGQQAWRLIEDAGLRGQGRGGARVSEVHANFIVNVGDATAADIEGLIVQIQETVYRRQGVRLQTEVRVVGEKAGRG